MPVPNSQRAKILNNLQRQLRTITTTNGYSRNIYDASLTVKTWTQVPEANTPTVFIVDEDAQYTYHPGKLIEVQWNIALYGVMKNKTQLEMEEFISDMDVCLTQNASLSFSDTGKVVSHIRIRNVITDDQLFAEIDGSQLFKMTISLIYTKCYGDR